PAEPGIRGSGGVAPPRWLLRQRFEPLAEGPGRKGEGREACTAPALSAVASCFRSLFRFRFSEFLFRVPVLACRAVRPLVWSGTGSKTPGWMPGRSESVLPDRPEAIDRSGGAAISPQP